MPEEIKCLDTLNDSVHKNCQRGSNPSHNLKLCCSADKLSVVELCENSEHSAVKSNLHVSRKVQDMSQNIDIGLQKMKCC